MEICLLGELEVWDRGAPLHVRGLKQRALLVLLALQRGASASATRLVEGVWGDDLPANSLNALRTQIAQLRRTLGAEAVVTTGSGYALVDADVDVVRFEQLVGQGRSLLADGDASAAADSLRQALTMRRGEPLAELASFDFAVAERAGLNELCVLAVEARIEADLALGRHAEVVGELESLCREHPLREGLWVLRMTALYRVGRQSEALRCFTEARQRLAEELGITPGAELQRAEAMVLAHDPALDLAPAGDAPPQPQPQLPRRGNLRAALTSFVGRDEEVAELCARARRARLVTLIGPGGVGKTRLAVEAAHRLAVESSDPVWLVELAGVSDPAGVGAAVARAVGVSEVSGGGSRAMSAVEVVVAQLLGTSVLVVVDNCEHVVAEAAAVIDELLGSLPQLRVIATSREILGVPGEALTQLGGLDAVAAAELFADRAVAVNDRFTLDDGTRPLVEEICARLDGLPLAIELAAARMRTLSLAQLASRLDDRFRLLTGGARTAMARQQTLKAVVDWSYELLSGDEQLVFDRLSVFRGGFTLHAAEAVCSDDTLPAGGVLDMLQRLVDKSLVDAGVGADGEARFDQLQTLWQYGHDRLAESGAGAVEARHAAYFKALAEAARDRGSSRSESRQRLNAELDNARRALAWFVERGDAEAALSLAVGTGWLFFTRAEFRQGARWVADALGVPGGAPNGLRCLAHAWHGYFSSFLEGSSVHLAECEAAAAGLGDDDDPELRADTLLLAASTLNRARERSTALDVLEQARPLLDRMGDPWRLGMHGLIAALTLENLGRLDEAEVAARDSARCFQDADDEWWVIEPRGILAGVAEDRGDLDGAAAAYEAVIESCRAVGGDFFEPRWLSRLAAVRARQGNDTEADRLYRETIASGRNPLLTAVAVLARARVVRRLGDLEGSRRLLEEGMARYEQLGIATGRAAAFAGLAWWALAAGDHAAAATFAERARATALAAGDAHSQLVADSALAAVAVVVDPSEQHRAELGAIARRRAFSGGVYGAILDELDVFSLAERYPPSS